MAWARTTALVAGAAVVAGSADAQQRQQVTGPVATYWMSAQTNTGFGAGMMGGGGRPNMGAMMGAIMGGGSNVSKTLTLQLGSSRKPAGEPAAEHLPPAALRTGTSLPLLTPRAQPRQPVEEDREPIPRDFQKPRGRMLIFWGCGERAGPGQPLVIDFAQLAAGRAPAGMEALSRGFGVTPHQPPSPSRNATYGEWPNERTRTQVPAAGSLVGDHAVRGNYAPEIRFALAQNQDFLGALNLTRNEVGRTGAGQLAWNALPNARGYMATAIGGGDNDTVAMWTSSEIQGSAFALPEYLSNGDIERLVASKALMAPATTSCAIPREMVQAAPNAMIQLAAYGGEHNISYPPRPADPKTPWNIEWEVKVRYRSATGGILGMDMPGMGDASTEDDPAARQPQQPSVGGAILRGVLGGRRPGT
ncbi:MAG: hypothetical protein ACK41C_07970 [Phenylobacterium sp.]|uniref:hypothetical protein n=1 Tax=Phenylobacterium sp. TaxID=1871053 RepID=UPI003918A16D